MIASPGPMRPLPLEVTGTTAWSCPHIASAGISARQTRARTRPISEAASRSEGSESRTPRATRSPHPRLASRFSRGLVASSRPPSRLEAPPFNPAQSVIDDIFSSRGPDPGVPAPIDAADADAGPSARQLASAEARNLDSAVLAPAHKVFAASTGIAEPPFAPMRLIGLIAIALGLAGMLVKAAIKIAPWWRRWIDHLRGYDSSRAEEWLAPLTPPASATRGRPKRHGDEVHLPNDSRNPWGNPAPAGVRGLKSAGVCQAGSGEVRTTPRWRDGRGRDFRTAPTARFQPSPSRAACARAVCA